MDIRAHTPDSRGVSHSRGEIIHSITYISRQSVIINMERIGVADHCDQQRCSEQHSGVWALYVL